MKRIAAAISVVVLLFAVAILVMSLPSGETGESRPVATTTTTRPRSQTASTALSVAPSSGLKSKGTVGGPFSPASIVYTLQNTGSASVRWTAEKMKLWITLSPTMGTLAPGASTTVTVSINDNASSLTPNTYTDTVTFWWNRFTGGGKTTRPVSLTLNPIAKLGVTPSDGLTSTGVYKGPFDPASIVYMVQNPGSTPINWTASSAQSWITLSPTMGTLAPGASTTVTVSINSNAKSLMPNTYTDTVTFANTTNGSENTTRSVGLTIAPAAGTAAQPDTEEQTMINLINTYRQQNALAPLTYSEKPQAAGDWMANDLATRIPSVSISHVDSLGRDIVARAQAFGFTMCSELAGMGVLTANQMLTMWQNSDMHNKYLLLPLCKTVGAAKATGPNGVFWIVNMGT